MHQLRNEALVRRFRMSALLFITAPLFFISSLVVIVISLWQIDWKLALVGVGLGMLAIICGALSSLNAKPN